MVPPCDALMVPAQLFSIRQLQSFNLFYFRSMLCSINQASKQCRGVTADINS